jgi:hypothetical protein
MGFFYDEKALKHSILKEIWFFFASSRNPLVKKPSLKQIPQL